MIVWSKKAQSPSQLMKCLHGDEHGLAVKANVAWRRAQTRYQGKRCQDNKHTRYQGKRCQDNEHRVVVKAIVDMATSGRREGWMREAALMSLLAVV